MRRRWSSGGQGWNVVVWKRNALCRVTYLNIWSEVYATICKDYWIVRKGILAGEGMSLGTHYQSSGFSSHSAFVIIVWTKMWSASFQVFSCQPSYFTWFLPFLSHQDGLYLSGTVIQNKPFFPELLDVLWFLSLQQKRKWYATPTSVSSLLLMHLVQPIWTRLRISMLKNKSSSLHECRSKSL